LGFTLYLTNINESGWQKKAFLWAQWAILKCFFFYSYIWVSSFMTTAQCEWVLLWVHFITFIRKFIHLSSSLLHANSDDQLLQTTSIFSYVFKYLCQCQIQFKLIYISGTWRAHLNLFFFINVGGYKKGVR
jgi:hypothetical protein